MIDCELCKGSGGELIWQNDDFRIIRATEPGYPCICRVISKPHIKEMTDLSYFKQLEMMHLVFTTEAALRRLYRPTKINLASFGNQVPHLHWHIIPRWHDDPHFPYPIWASAVRQTNSDSFRPEITLAKLSDTLCSLLKQNSFLIDMRFRYARRSY